MLSRYNNPATYSAAAIFGRAARQAYYNGDLGRWVRVGGRLVRNFYSGSSGTNSGSSFSSGNSMVTYRSGRRVGRRSGQLGARAVRGRPGARSRALVRRPSRRRLPRSLYPSGFGTQRGKLRRPKSFKRKRSRSAKRGGKRSASSTVNEFLYKKICTPQIWKNTWAFARGGVLNQRQFLSVLLGSTTVLAEWANKRPTSFAQLTAAPSVTLYGSDRYTMRVQQYFKKFVLHNRSNSSMHLKIYTCLPRNDLNFDQGVTGWAGIFQTDTSVGTAGVGPGQNADPTGLTEIWQYPQFTPYQSSLFCEYFKIVNEESVVLNPQEYIHRKYSCRPRDFKGAYIGGIGTDLIRGFGKYILFSWVGQPIDDGTISNQGRAQCDLFVTTEEYGKYCFLPGVAALTTTEVNTTDLSTGATNSYRIDPAGFTPHIGPSMVFEPVDTTDNATADFATGIGVS